MGRFSPSRLLPGVALFAGYERAWLTADSVAALTVWAMLVPQSLAYATLAGVPPVYGLYAALGAMTLYFFFGTSRELNMGPESAVALLVATIITPLADDPEEYLALAAMLALLVGGWCIVGYLLRLGWVTDFLSRPILAGYILGSAVIIIVSQLPALLGLSVDSEQYLTERSVLIAWSGRSRRARRLGGQQAPSRRLVRPRPDT